MPSDEPATRSLRPLPVWFLECVVVVVLMVTVWIWLHGRPRGQEPRLHTYFQVDVNHADLMSLAALPGLGQSIGQRIIDYRQAHGRFTRPDELAAINGIGQIKLKQLLPWIHCGPGVAAATSQPAGVLSPDGKKSGGPAGEPPLEELDFQSIP